MPTRGGGTVFAPPKRSQARPPPADHTPNINIGGRGVANEAAATCPSQARSSTRGGAKTVPPPVGDSSDRASHHGVYPQPAVTNVTRAGVAVGARVGFGAGADAGTDAGGSGWHVVAAAGML